VALALELSQNFELFGFHSLNLMQGILGRFKNQNLPFPIKYSDKYSLQWARQQLHSNRWDVKAPA
jgi:hypothetical protein